MFNFFLKKIEYMCMCDPWANKCMWLSEDNLQESILSCHHVHKSWRLNWGNQTWQQAPLTAEPSGQPVPRDFKIIS